MRQTVLRIGPELRRRILLVVVFLTPLFFLRSAYDIFNVPKLALLMVGVVFVVAIRAVELLQGADPSGLRLIVVPAAAVAAALCIGTLFSPYRVWTLIGDHSRFTGLLPYLAVVLLGIVVADTFRGEVRPLAWAFIVSGAVAGAYASLQVAGLDPIQWSATRQATVTIGNTNFVGAFFAICLPVGVGLLILERDRRFLVATLCSLVAVGWVLARSEAAWGAGAAGLLVLAGQLLSRRWNPARVVGFVAAFVIAGAGVALVALAMTERAPGVIPPTIARRAEWWGASLRMVKNSPVFGRGPNSFAIEHTHHRDIDDVIVVGSDVTDDPHSVPLSFVTAAGIFGLTGFFVLAGWIVRMALRGNPDAPLAAGFGAAGIVYLVQSSLSIDVVTLRLAAWTVIGGLAAALAPPLPDPPRAPPGKKKKKKKVQSSEPLRALPGVVAIILVASLAAAWVMGFLSADVRFRRGLSMAAAGAPGARETLRSAIGFRQTNLAYRTHYGNLVGGNAVRQGLSEDGDQKVAEALIQEAQEVFSFIEWFPHANSVLTYARVMRDWAAVDSSAEDEALDLYERASELDPNNFLVLEEAARAAESFGRPEVAAHLNREASRLRPPNDDRN